MQVRNLGALRQQLQKNIAPVYLLSSDEPLQLMEAADAVRSAVRKWGAMEREVFDVDAKFDWNRLSESANTLSLFSERRLLELRLPSGKPGRDGGRALKEYAERPAEDAVLLIVAGKIDSASLKSKWFKSLDRQAVVIRLWPVEIEALPQWIEHRMHDKGMVPEVGVSTLLADRVEGNLLAASQEIEKLLLSNGAGPVSVETVLAAVSDNARFDVFSLVDSALVGNTSRSQHMLSVIRAEGVPEAVVLWALVKEVRGLAKMAYQINGGDSIESQLRSQRVWEKRKPAIRAALQRFSLPVWLRLVKRCAKADRIVKGAERGDGWDELLQLTLALSGTKPLSGM